MKRANIVEVGPRDGFQSVAEFIPTETKVKIIGMLADAGISKIQATSFVSPKAIPQMRDAAEVVARVMETHPGLALFALVPNLRGAEGAVGAGLKEIATVMSLSETHNMNNVRMTVDQSVEGVAKMREAFPNIKISQDIGTAFGCPFEGKMAIDALLELVRKISAVGIDEFTLCDTIGVAYPAQVREVMRAVRAQFPKLTFNIHIHDTRNMGVINSYTALLEGAGSIQLSVAGLGGCPFAPGASGNTATEDFVYMLHLEGYDTGVDFDRLLAAAKFVKETVSGNFSGHHIHITDRQMREQ